MCIQSEQIQYAGGTIEKRNSTYGYLDNILGFNSTSRTPHMSAPCIDARKANVDGTYEIVIYAITFTVISNGEIF